MKEEGEREWEKRRNVPLFAAGPSQQTNIVQSASGIDENITFSETINSIFVNFDLTDDLVALEPIEQYDVRLELLVDDSRIMFGSPEVTTVNVLDDDGAFHTSALVQLYITHHHKHIFTQIQYIHVNMASHDNHVTCSLPPHLTTPLSSTYVRVTADVTVSFGRPSLTVSESDQYFTMCVVKSSPTLVVVSAQVGDVPGTATSPMGEETY